MEDFDPGQSAQTKCDSEDPQKYWAEVLCSIQSIDDGVLTIGTFSRLAAIVGLRQHGKAAWVSTIDSYARGIETSARVEARYVWTICARD